MQFMLLIVMWMDSDGEKYSLDYGSIQDNDGTV